MIPDYEWKSCRELSDEIRIVDNDLSKIIDAFFKAYEAWFEVHQDIETEGDAGTAASEAVHPSWLAF